jgi:cytoskeletal protein CcmA (bactofilin family)
MIGNKPGHGSDGGEATSIIGENSAFDGNFQVNGNLRVDGKFSGQLHVSDTLVVGKNGLIDAEVHTRCAVVAGTIKGDLHASEKITLQSGSHLEGEMVTARLVIEEGVSFQGSCKTAKTVRQTPKPATPAAPTAKSTADAATTSEIEQIAAELATKK